MALLSLLGIDRLLVLLAPDGGGGQGGEGGTADGATAGASGDAPAAAGQGGDDKGDGGDGAGEPFDPSTKLETRHKAKYESQLKPDYQKDDFRDVETIDKLYEGYRSLERKLKDTPVIPTADSTPEEIKEYFVKIGMPEEPEGYKCTRFDDMTDFTYNALMPKFREAAYRCGLTKGQAEQMWIHEAATLQGFVSVAKQKDEEARTSFDSRYDKLLESEIPDATRRAARIEEEKNVVKAFCQSTGLAEYLDKTGLTLNPIFMHTLASWYSQIAPMAVLGDGGTAQETGLSGMDSLIRLYRKKR